MLPNYQARSPFVLKHTTSLCMGVRMSICTLTHRIFVFAPRSTRPKLH